MSIPANKQGILNTDSLTKSTSGLRHCLKKVAPHASWAPELDCVGWTSWIPRFYQVLPRSNAPPPLDQRRAAGAEAAASLAPEFLLSPWPWTLKKVGTLSDCTSFALIKLTTYHRTHLEIASQMQRFAKCLEAHLDYQGKRPTFCRPPGQVPPRTIRHLIGLEGGRIGMNAHAIMLLACWGRFLAMMRSFVQWFSKNSANGQTCGNEWHFQWTGAVWACESNTPAFWRSIRLSCSFPTNNTTNNASGCFRQFLICRQPLCCRANQLVLLWDVPIIDNRAEKFSHAKNGGLAQPPQVGST